MKKVFSWVIGLTKAGKNLNSFFDGKKQAIAGLATALAGTATVIGKLAEEGTPYLLKAASSPEFAVMAGGWVAFFNALKGEKIRAEIEASQK